MNSSFASKISGFKLLSLPFSNTDKFVKLVTSGSTLAARFPPTERRVLYSEPPVGTLSSRDSIPSATSVVPVRRKRPPLSAGVAAGPAAGIKSGSKAAKNSSPVTSVS